MNDFKTVSGTIIAALYAMGKPDEALTFLIDDLCETLSKGGVDASSLEGVRLGLRLAYRLGEQADKA